MIIRLDEIDSTNEYAKRLVEDGYSSDEMCVVSAQYQTAGKGRRGRGWITPPGTCLTFSILYRPGLPTEACPMITLVMAMAVRAALFDFDIECQIKWPNDIIIGGKKLCGILTEAIPDSDYKVVGCGINLNQEAFPEDLADKATSILIETDDCVDEDNLLESIVGYFEKYAESLTENKNLSGLMDEYNDMLVSKDKEVTVLDPKGEYEGISEGINQNGELIVRRPDGSKELVYAGEVSVRGVYGYV